MRIALLLLLPTSAAFACSCAPSAYYPLCQRIENIKVLFAGSVIETNDNHDGFIKSGAWYRVAVEEAFKGIGSDVREVIVNPASGTSCQDEYTVGKRYLFSSYGDTVAAQPTAVMSLIPGQNAGGKAQPPGLVVTTGVCSGTRELMHAAADVKYARQYLNAPQAARITGEVRSHASEFLWNSDSPPLAGVAIRLSGSGGRVERTTGIDGNFEIADVAPGKYGVTASLEGYVPERPLYDIDVPAHGCGIANIAMFTNAIVSGTVLRADGSPAARVPVEAILADRKYRLRPMSVKTAEDGHFRIAKLPAGDLLIGVHINSAVTSKERMLPVSARVHLRPNEHKDGLVLRLGPSAQLRSVKVQVQWPDGKAGSNLRVSALCNGYYCESGKTDEQGAVELTLVDGVEYTFQSRAFTSYRNVNGNQIGSDWVDVEKRTLAAGSGPAEVALTLNQPKPKR